MEDNLIPTDDPINYFNTNFKESSDESPFNSIFIGCPKPASTPLWVLFGIVLGIYFILSLFVSNILLVPMSVEGSSMYPTLNHEYSTTGNTTACDVVYLSKTQDVSKQDIVVFNATPYNSSHKQNSTIYYIKRVIATAGDRIKFKKFKQISSTAYYEVYLNGILLEENYISQPISYSSPTITPKIILNEEEVIIPNGCIFVMGDNRNNSKDSRELGVINTSDVLGKVVLHIEYGETLLQGLIKSIKHNYLF